MKKSVEDQLYILGLSLLALAVFGMTVLRVFHISLTDIVPGCFLYHLTGLYCPGCGATRALTALMEGHPVRSFVYHPVVNYVVFLGLWFLLSQTIQRISRGKLRIGMKYRDLYLWILLAILVLHCVIRNVLKLSAGIGMPL